MALTDVPAVYSNIWTVSANSVMVRLTFGEGLNEERMLARLAVAMTSGNAERLARDILEALARIKAKQTIP